MTAKVTSLDNILRAMTAASDFVKDKFNVASERAIKDLVHPDRWVSTGSIALDRAISSVIPGGIPIGPRGCVAHIFGDPSLGKSLILDHLVLNVQKLGGVGLISETEGTRSPHFAEAIGVDLTRLDVQRPESIEELVDAGLAWIRKFTAKAPGVPVVWGWDSLELTEAKRTQDVDMSGKEGGVHRFGGGRAEAISLACRKIAKVCAKQPVTFVILNQVRENVGVMFGAAKKPTGGWAARFFASVEVQLYSSKYGRIMENGRAVGRWVHAKIVKNKVAPPFAECDFLIRFDKGVNFWSGLPQMLEDEGYVKLEKDKKGNLIPKRNFVVVGSGDKVPIESFGPWVVKSGILRHAMPSPPRPADAPADDEDEEGIDKED